MMLIVPHPREDHYRAMNARDRDYFMLRARQERRAMTCSGGQARRRHEELASAYEMRVTYIDRGLFSSEPDPPRSEEPMPIPNIILA
jgi:hypothetical protein